MLSIAPHGAELFETWKADPRTPGDGLKEITQLLARVPEDEATKFKGLLIGLAVAMARASGSWIGDKISDQERAGVMTLAQILEFDVRDAVGATYGIAELPR